MEIIMTLSTLPPAAMDASAHRTEAVRGPGAILALDLGTHTGWALAHADGTIVSGTERFRQDRWSGGGMPFLRFRHWLGEVAETSGSLGLVVYEEVRAHAGTAAAHAYGGFLATLTAWAEGAGVPYEGVPVGTIKRFAVGKGNASKAAVIEAMRRAGFAPKDDNEADALALLRWSLVHRAGGLA
jgi:hypothetical protein